MFSIPELQLYLETRVFARGFYHHANTSLLTSFIPSTLHQIGIEWCKLKAIGLSSKSTARGKRLKTRWDYGSNSPFAVCAENVDAFPMHWVECGKTNSMETTHIIIPASALPLPPCQTLHPRKPLPTGTTQTDSTLGFSVFSPFHTCRGLCDFPCDFQVLPHRLWINLSLSLSTPFFLAWTLILIYPANSHPSFKTQVSFGPVYYLCILSLLSNINYSVKWFY